VTQSNHISTGFYIIDADGTNFTTLKVIEAGSGINSRSLSWQPDGSRLAYYSDDSFYTITPDGSDLREYTLPDEIQKYDWSPDSTRVVFRVGFNLYILDINDSNVTQITDFAYPVHISDPDWSPNDDTITFIVRSRPQDEKNWDVYTINSDGSQMQNITNNPSNNKEYPTWAPDGTKIAFISRGSLYVMDVDGTNLIQLDDPLNLDVGYFVWSTDGTKITFSTWS
jgi:Tol biopolymer transport system component